MMQPLSRGEIEVVVRRAGFTGADVDVAVAVALAESGGDPAQVNPEPQANPVPSKGSIGLFQIFRWQHPETWGISIDDLCDPLLNARLAYLLIYIPRGKTFVGWSTFNSGAYKKFLQPSFAVADPELGQ